MRREKQNSGYGRSFRSSGFEDPGDKKPATALLLAEPAQIKLRATKEEDFERASHEGERGQLKAG